MRKKIERGKEGSSMKENVRWILMSIFFMIIKIFRVGVITFSTCSIEMSKYSKFPRNINNL